MTMPFRQWWSASAFPNAARIDRAARFVDSVAKLFTVPVPRHLHVMVGASMDDGVENRSSVGFVRAAPERWPSAIAPD